MLENIQQQITDALTEFLPIAKLQKGDVLVLGCSSSEIAGYKIGTVPSPDVASALLSALLPPLQQQGIFLAVQCCEHLNRAVVVEQAALEKYGFVQVNALPHPKAGGSTATKAWQLFGQPVLVEDIQAKGAAGFDIGSTLIGMHLRPVVVPVRLAVQNIGSAKLVAARTRPHFVGGSRAIYDEALL